MEQLAEEERLIERLNRPLADAGYPRSFVLLADMEPGDGGRYDWINKDHLGAAPSRTVAPTTVGASLEASCQTKLSGRYEVHVQGEGRLDGFPAGCLSR